MTSAAPAPQPRLSPGQRWSFALLVVALAGTGVVGVTFWAFSRNREPPTRILEVRDPRYPCGNVCIATVSHLLDRPVTLGQTARVLPVDPEGLASLLEVQQALQQLGFVARGVKFDRLADLAECMLPAILHVRERHFVVAVPAKGGWVIVLDPPRAPRLLQPHALRDQWKGVSLLVSSSEERMDRLLWYGAARGPSLNGGRLRSRQATTCSRLDLSAGRRFDTLAF